jgi:ATP-dependent protease ClpP protease subunit
MSETHPRLAAQRVATLKAEEQFYLARTEAQRYAIADFAKKEREDEAGADEARIFSFYSGIDEMTCKQCMATLGYWARQHEPGTQDFTIEITSSGGSVLDGFALIDTIRDLQSQGYIINTIGKGWVASMAALLLQAGNTRTLGRRSYVLIHEIQSQMAGSASDLDDKQGFTKRLARQGHELLAERSTLTADEIAKRSERREWYMDASEAVELGFADGLLAEKMYA